MMQSHAANTMLPAHCCRFFVTGNVQISSCAHAAGLLLHSTVKHSSVHFEFPLLHDISHKGSWLLQVQLRLVLLTLS